MSKVRAFVQSLLALVIASIVLLAAAPAQAQVFFANTRVANAVFSRATVGTTTAEAIADASVSSNLLGWKICNDAVNTSTYLLIGEAVDAATDGVMVGPGVCFECPNCSASTLKAINVKAQAASNGYSVVQFK